MGGKRILNTSYVRDPDNELGPEITKWFKESVGEPTDLQRRAWSSIRSGDNVLIVSPTGSGKTLSAVIPAVDDVIRGVSARGSTSILYISPMKALGADLMRMLEDLSNGLGRIPGKKERKRGRRSNSSSLPDAFLDVGIRTGDVPQSARRRMLVDPPDILVITPENLLLMACSKAREILGNVRFIIIDEVHEMVASKRGALLSLTLEYLSKRAEEITGSLPQRIGLSATIRPERLAAGYIGGSSMDGKLRDVTIIKEERAKEVQINLRTLFTSLEREPEIEEAILAEIGDQISKQDGSMVVFHNTRRQSEEMAFSLTGRGIEGVLPHHGSLGPDVRKEAEEGLKSGSLKAIISSTSLELGIDIGSVQRVCQISSPKDPGKLLQRLGRSGHGLGRISKGTLYPKDTMDLLECVAVARAAVHDQLEKKIAQEEPMDVLAQFTVGLSIVMDDLDVAGLWKLVRGAYPYRKVKKKDIHDLVLLLTERLPGANQTPPRLWKHDENGTLHPRRNSKQAFYLNCGTIPKETTFRVLEDRKRRMIGNLSRDFGEALYERDVILLGSRSFRVVGFTGQNIIVREDPEAQPTIPRWSGEVNPRPLSISDHILEVLKNPRQNQRIEGEKGTRLEIDDAGLSALETLVEHMKDGGTFPNRKIIPIERISKGKEKRTYVFHIPLGRMVTEPLGRVLAYGIRKDLGAMVDYIATDDGFAISSPTDLSEEKLIEAFGGDEFMSMAKDLILSSSMFRTRFSHILGKSLLVLSRFRGKETGSIYRRNRVSSLLSILMDTYYSPTGWKGAKGPLSGLVILGREALNEVFREKVDLETASSLVQGMKNGSITINIVDRKNDPSVPARSIMSTWEKKSARKGPSSGNIRDMTEELPEAIELDGGEGGVIDLRSILLSYPEEGSGTGDSDLRNFRRLPFRVQLGKEVSFTELGLTEDDIVRSRFQRTMIGNRTGTVFRSLPFFSHPINVMSRSPSADLLSIRSAIRSRRLRPLKVMGKDVIVDPFWERTFVSLMPEIAPDDDNIRKLLISGKPISRMDVKVSSGLSGDDLTELMSKLSRSGFIASYPEETRFHLGAPTGTFSTSAESDIKREPEDQLRSMIDLLERMGPFSLEELSIMLYWPENMVPQGLTDGIASGTICIGTGPSPPILRRSCEDDKSEDIWIWTKGPDRMIKGDDQFPNIPLHNKDPALILTGRDPKWVEKEKVFKSLTGHFIINDDAGETANWTALERCDQIIIRSLEVEEFTKLEELVSRCVDLIEVYKRMGYETIRIEKIMGVPAGESAERALGPFLRSGFKRSDTLKGKILIRTEEMCGGLEDRSVLGIMLARQHLSPGTYLDHPLQVLGLLGGISDRWEVLSRIGARRNKKLTEGNISNVELRFRERYHSFISRIKDEEDDYNIDWSPMISGWFEDISDMKDLSKRFNLFRGRLDQPGLSWSFRPELEKFPERNTSFDPQLSPLAKELLDSTKGSTTEEWNNRIKVHSLSKAAQELVISGMAIEDPWGEFIPLERNIKRKKKGKWFKGTLKGVSQRAWVLRCADALGAFRIEDLINYSPELDDISKIRSILHELSDTHLERSMDPQGTGDIIYHLPAIPALNVGSSQDADEKDIVLTLISPRDRMWRVIFSYMRGSLSKGSGFAVFRGDKSVAYLTMRKMARGPRNLDDDGRGSYGGGAKEHWLIKKAWLDLRIPRKDLMRQIRKRFFDLGIEVLSEDERTKIEDLYRDLDTRDEIVEKGQKSTALPKVLL